MNRFVFDEDLFNIIFSSLPHSYDSALSALSTQMLLNRRTISPEELMGFIIGEYDRFILRDGTKSKPKATDDVALAVNDNSALVTIADGPGISRLIAGRKVVESSDRLRMAGISEARRPSPEVMDPNRRPIS